MVGVGDDAFREMEIADRQRYRAIKNALTEIGEAAKAIPEDIRQRHPETKWRNFAGLRDIVAHQYFRVRPEPLLLVIRNDVPKMSEAVALELARPGPEDACGF